jgi:hypothetical protein
MTELDDLFDDFSPNGRPSTHDHLTAAERALRGTVPEDLAEFLMTTGPGEGFIDEAFLRIWPPEEWAEHNSTLHPYGLWPNLVLFGSDASNWLFGFDRDSSEFFSVERVGDLEPRWLGGSFLEFIGGIIEVARYEEGLA